jgi:uncharacterized protein YndB with AHSA1/START domain
MKMVNQRDIVSTERLIRTPASTIFDVIADPRRHPDFDGSGSVKKARPDSPTRLFLGAIFAMDMKRGLRYGMANTVTEFEEDRRIAWAPKPASGKGARFFGRIWRYELEPVEGGTLVRETWDISQEPARLLLRHMSTKRFRKDMVKSLGLLEGLVTNQS